MRYEKLSSTLFIKNRAKLVELLPHKSMVIISSNDIMPTNADGTMGFKQNSDLFYLLIPKFELQSKAFFQV